MQYSTIFLAILAASGAMAAPQGSRPTAVQNSRPATTQGSRPAATQDSRVAADKEVRVILSDLGETGAQNVFSEGKRVSGRPSQSGPFKTVALKLGAKVNNKDLRCQILDENNKPIVVKRGANTDITFADGDKGEWTFRAASKVSNIICDESFKKIGADATEIRVVLSSQSPELGSQTTFTDGQRQTKSPVGSSGPFQTVELRLGQLVDPELRCQILDEKKQPITVLRGENVAVTFADGDKGEWTLKQKSKVSSIICDPAF